MYFSFLQAEQLQIANYYDLFNSLINWSSRKWGCSGGPFKKHTLFIDTTLRDYSKSYYTNIWHFWITYTHYTLLSPITGEHVTGLYSQRDGKLTPLKADLDILNVKEDDVIVIEIKDWQSRLFCKKNVFYKASFNVVWLTVPNNQTPIDLSVL